MASLQAEESILELNDKNQSHNNSTHIGTSTLQIFLNGNTLTLLNYSLLESSLNIKPECKNAESKKILKKEKQTKENMESTPTLSKGGLRGSGRIDSKSPIFIESDSIESTAMLHPILEDNEIKCPHNGMVKLKSIKGKNFKSNNISMILESDLINSLIIGCTNNILGIPNPCAKSPVIYGDIINYYCRIFLESKKR